MVSIRIFNYFVLLVTASLIFLSCDSRRFFENNKKIDQGVWKRTDKIRFEVTIPDTTTGYDFFINVRNDVDYPYANLYLFIETLTPAGIISRDTVECQLADYTGKWFGKGIGSVKFNRFLFRKMIRFRVPGKYFFGLEQAMRVNDLKGIRDVGLRIEKHN
jgi:gliding motility-associated lipoprotein GldH